MFGGRFLDIGCIENFKIINICNLTHCLNSGLEAGAGSAVHGEDRRRGPRPV